MWLFDPRVTYDEWSDCELGIDAQLFPLYESTSIEVTAEHITDHLGYITSPYNPTSPDRCTRSFRRLLSSSNPPYSTYTFTAKPGSLPPGSFQPEPLNSNSSVNVNGSSQGSQSIIVHFDISFHTLVVRTTTTASELPKLQIWLQAAAIVGAIQFFAMILKGG